MFTNSNNAGRTEIYQCPMDMTDINSTSLRGTLHRDEPMSRHTSWRTGGTAENYYIPADLDDLCNYMAGIKPGEAITWVGLGSNILVRDGGLHGHVISVTGVLDQIDVHDNSLITAGAGVTCAKLARTSASAGYAGLEFFAGIPGTVGGALAMNAGAFGSETWQFVSKVTTLDRSGKTRQRSREEFETGYRQVNLPVNEWFIDATFQLFQDKASRAQEQIKLFLSQRTATQPTGQSSCGSVFRNPEGNYAGRLIDECGLKGRTIGAAKVSGKHANFIINEGGASAAEIEDLILLIQKSVREMTGIWLEPEVKIVGERNAGLQS